ncbi:MAG: hypothetical protein WC360_06890 [Opitutales bacterium]|jgi:hypothetical protein
MEGYLRGTFDTLRFLRAVQIAAQEAGFVVEHCYGAEPEPVLVLKRVCMTPKANFYVSTGVHGDEPAGLIDGHPAAGGLIRPQDTGPRMRGDEYPEALYMLDRYTRHSYTLEAPSNRDLSLRIDAHEAALLAAADSLRNNGHWFDI